MCVVIGAPVARWACAQARSTRSTPGVTPGRSVAHLIAAALIPVPAMPSVMSLTNRSTIGSLPFGPDPGVRRLHQWGSSLNVYRPVVTRIFSSIRSASVAMRGM